MGGFTQRFPNVGLNLTVDLSKYHASRIDRSFYANDEYIDVAVLQTVQNYLQWKAQNRLMFYKPQNFSDIDNDEKDFDGANLPSLLCECYILIKGVIRILMYTSTSSLLRLLLL